MTLDDVKEFTKKVGFGFLATSDGDRASVRPMGGSAWVDGEFWCCTGTGSVKVADVRKNPRVEYCFAGPNGNHVRIEGVCMVSEAREDRAKLLELHPGLENYVGDADCPTFAVLRLEVQRVRCWAEDRLGYEEVELS